MNDDLIERIEAMRHLDENWDSYGARAINQAAIRRAIVLVREIIDGNPHVTATNYGHIVFEGNNGTTIEIGEAPIEDTVWIEEEPLDDSSQVADEDASASSVSDDDPEPETPEKTPVTEPMTPEHLRQLYYLLADLVRLADSDCGLAWNRTTNRWTVFVIGSDSSILAEATTARNAVGMCLAMWQEPEE